ncbi:hypothetical protein [Lentzea sp. NEAU-D7]|uniref:hypothetical protein n=1 Tax=Lentzea sp. NEAU-D7 TaxID=2994667 RepID=UPI00224ABFD1|nr:hypothetical protein [Lentzea sp. NEAU-D7]MCX2949696.1 hypothetical protein [Lentzea sp. NEAU-D7]
MIAKYRKTGPDHLAAAVRALTLGGRADDGVDHRVVDWVMGGLAESAARDVEARLNGYLQEAADLGRSYAQRRCRLWLAACVPVLIVLAVLLTLAA